MGETGGAGEQEIDSSTKGYGSASHNPWNTELDPELAAEGDDVEEEGV